ncbi:LytTR family DNA-binding domain-containing protein [Winogradskyella aurantia]|nr:LytTR family DNA-binding domain-containing protein [Winogradskyella aurantia]
MKRNYPFDPLLKHHVLISLMLAIWIFIFLYFTEPLDVSSFGDREKLIFLPGYGIVGGLCYLLFIPLQQFLFHKNNKQWTLASEAIFLISVSVISIVLARSYYLYVVMANDRNPYDLWYMLKTIFLPAIITIVPIIGIGRFAFGKYHEKRLDRQKIEIKGEGNYEGLRLLLNDLISIQSSDNYIEVFYLSGNQVKKTLIRNTLSAIDEEFPELIRTHRSYLVNPFHFMQWKTDSGKRFMQLNYDIIVPISKTYQNEVISVINSTTKL